MEKIKLEEKKILKPETYKEYKTKYNFYGMKYTLTFEEGYKYEEKINEIKRKIPFYYTLVKTDNNAFKIKPDEAIEVQLKTNFKAVQKRKRSEMQRQKQREMEEQRQRQIEEQMQQQQMQRRMQQQRPRKRRWTERKKRKHEEGRKRRRPWPWPKKRRRLYDNLLALKF